MESRVGEVADADGQIETMGSQIQRMIADLQLHLDLGIARMKGSEGRADIASAKTQGRIDSYQALGRRAAAADQLLHLIDLREDALGVVEVHLPLGRQAHGPGCPGDQANAQAGFEGTQPLAHRRRGHPKFPGGRCQAAFLGKQMEKSEIEGLAYW